MSAISEEGVPTRRLIYRHRLVVRITHWINVLCITVLLMSGMQIFNAHPALYLGQRSHFDSPVLAMGQAPESDEKPVGVTTILGHGFTTTGVLGVSRENGELVERGFPSWATLPSYQDLATGRRWHFFFAWLFVANGLVYLAYSLTSGHLRELVPSRDQLRHIGGSIWEHMRLHFPKGDEARHYNVLQKLAYFGIVIIVLPLLVLAGLTMSPGIDAAFPWLVDLFGGRQTARTIHFICATLVVLFILVHLVMVLVSGVFNNLRSMITGNYAIEPKEKPDAR
ncbi:cytochrome b/b6 domain-containing protein [Kaistia terrae]|uniref:Cytochrome b/b6 domain-containing protein n=1 Tax=Kaistia terrae TaxID=537017 RepID=A0ABW0PRM2_9HYPH|nr:cytochrome b/b6 domain-containing protein [Kaistia terrae]MCX5580001.1 cytochrome b/b6 domain-containing protein [Kaistia terrae]